MSRPTDAELSAAVTDGRHGDLDAFEAMAEIDRRQAEVDAEIRRLYVEERLSERALAERLGITRHAVRQVLGGVRREPRSEMLHTRLTRQELEDVREAVEVTGRDPRDVLLAWARAALE